MSVYVAWVFVVRLVYVHTRHPLAVQAEGLVVAFVIILAVRAYQPIHHAVEVHAYLSGHFISFLLVSRHVPCRISERAYRVIRPHKIFIVFFLISYDYLVVA